MVTVGRWHCGWQVLASMQRDPVDWWLDDLSLTCYLSCLLRELCCLLCDLGCLGCDLILQCKQLLLQRVDASFIVRHDARRSCATTGPCGNDCRLVVDSKRKPSRYPSGTCCSKMIGIERSSGSLCTPSELRHC